MNVRAAASISLVFALAACEQESQSLPFSPDSEATTVRNLSATEPGYLTSPAGAAVRFPAGSLRQATEVSITPVAPPAEAASSGSPVSRGFHMTPAGLELDTPATVELRIDGGIEPHRSWLASLVVVTPAGVEEVGGTRLDLSAGLARASIHRLGTLAMVIPDADAVFLAHGQGAQASLSPATTSLLPLGTDSVTVGCGDAELRCAGLSVSASDNLSGKVAQLAAVYPRVDGALTFAGSRASGELALSTSVRLLLSSGVTAENVELHGLLRPTDATVVAEDAEAITLTNMLIRISGSVGSEQGSSETLRTIVIRKSGSQGYVSVSRSFELPDDSGHLEPASVAITFPVQIHQ